MQIRAARTVEVQPFQPDCQHYFPGHSTDECVIVKKSLTLVMIVDKYPSDIRTHVYTDGSASAAIKDGGAGVFISHIKEG